MFGRSKQLAVPEGEIVDGEIVDDVQDRPKIIVVRPVINVFQVVVKHPHTRRASRHIFVYPVIGAATIAKRLWENTTTSRYDRMLRAAEAAGNHEVALDWDKQRADFVKSRSERRLKTTDALVNIAMSIPDILAGVVIVFILMGGMLALAMHNVKDVALPVIIAARVVEAVSIVLSVTWGPLLIAIPWMIYAWLWYLGRAVARATYGWDMALKPGEENKDVVITADTIVLALQNLDRIPALKRAFAKDCWRPQFILTPVREGRGYAATFSLPLGVTPEMIADQRSVFARNMHREEIEVWPSAGPPGFCHLWVADSGAISKSAPEYPLLHEGSADVFEGVPGGVIARGDATLIPVVANNMVCGGQMGQGKSNACRVFMLGCALDPIAELDVFVFANNGDFDSYKPRLARYHKGVDDDVIQAAVHRLSELYEEVARREGRIADLGAKKVTRGIALQHEDLRPIVALFSECHEMFGHPEYGARAADLATKTIKRARKVAVTLVFDTQSSRKEAIPPKLVELVSVNACFYVKSWRSNDGFLGDGSFQAGIRATELRPGRDRGTAVVTGISDQQFELLRWYFVKVDDDAGFDAAEDVIARAMRQVDARTPIESSQQVIAIEGRDLLYDLADVLNGHTRRFKLADLPGMLRKYAPHYVEYKTLTGVRLKELLDEAGVRTINTSNIIQLDPADLRQALVQRELDD